MAIIKASNLIKKYKNENKPKIFNAVDGLL